MWSFCGSKQNPQCLEQSGTFRACSRVWLALCRTTRQVVGVAVGDRSEKTCRALWSSVVWRFKKTTCHRDFWQAYQNVIPSEQHHAVGKESGETAHIERFNNTLRQRAGPTGCRLAQDSVWDALSAKRYPSRSASGCTSTASSCSSIAITPNMLTFGFELLPKVVGIL